MRNFHTLHAGFDCPVGLSRNGRDEGHPPFSEHCTEDLLDPSLRDRGIDKGYGMWYPGDMISI